MLNKKLNNRGVGRKEVIIGLFVIFVLMAILLYKSGNVDDETSIKNFKRLAVEFIDEAGIVRDQVAGYEDIVYLYDAINLNYMKGIESPFDKEKYCDEYESKIKMKEARVYLTFKCSEYLIYDQPTTEEYVIYKVSDWSEEPIEGNNVQTTTFYNYTIDGEEQLDEYYIEKEFLAEYSMKSGFTTRFLSNMLEGHELVKKTYYRTMEEVE